MAVGDGLGGQSGVGVGVAHHVGLTVVADLEHARRGHLAHPDARTPGTVDTHCHQNNLLINAIAPAVYGG